MKCSRYWKGEDGHGKKKDATIIFCQIVSLNIIIHLKNGNDLIHPKSRKIFFIINCSDFE